MVTKADIDAIWDGAEPFQIATEYDAVIPVEPQRCAWAEQYHTFSQGILSALSIASHPVKLRQAKYLLTERYMEFRARTPKAHRDRLGSKHHICIYQVFVGAYEYVSSLQLSVIPPQIELTHEPAASTPKLPAMSTIFGIDDDWYPVEEVPDDADKPQ